MKAGNQSKWVSKISIGCGAILIALLTVCPGFSQRFNYYHHNDSLKVITYTYSLFINIHWVDAGNVTLLIDTGNVGDEQKIESAFLKEGLILDSVDYLIITHGHADHAGNAHYFQQKYGMTLVAGAAETSLFRAGGHDKALCPRGFNGWFVQRTIGGKTYTPFEPDLLVQDTLDLNTLGVNGSIISLPGHTPGSIVTFIDDIAFTGDLIAAKPLNKDKPNYHTFMCDLKDNLNDIRTVADVPGIQTWYLGHMGPLKTNDVNEFLTKQSQK
ncbi:MAG: MBL fold metallo-hydrolase [Bacteroidota bacterium]